MHSLKRGLGMKVSGDGVASSQAQLVLSSWGNTQLGQAIWSVFYVRAW